MPGYMETVIGNTVLMTPNDRFLGRRSFEKLVHTMIPFLKKENGAQQLATGKKIKQNKINISGHSRLITKTYQTSDKTLKLLLLPNKVYFFVKMYCVRLCELRWGMYLFRNLSKHPEVVCLVT